MIKEQEGWHIHLKKGPMSSVSVVWEPYTGVADNCIGFLSAVRVVQATVFANQIIGAKQVLGYSNAVVKRGLPGICGQVLQWNRRYLCQMRIWYESSLNGAAACDVV